MEERGKCENKEAEILGLSSSECEMQRRASVTSLCKLQKFQLGDFLGPESWTEMGYFHSLSLLFFSALLIHL